MVTKAREEFVGKAFELAVRKVTGNSGADDSESRTLPDVQDLGDGTFSLGKRAGTGKSVRYYPKTVLGTPRKRGK